MMEPKCVIAKASLSARPEAAATEHKIEDAHALN